MPLVAVSSGKTAKRLASKTPQTAAFSAILKNFVKKPTSGPSKGPIEQMVSVIFFLKSESMKCSALVPAAFAIVLILGAYGCNSPETGTPAASTTPTASEDVHDEHDHGAHAETEDKHAGHDHATHDQYGEKSDMEKMNDALASFSEDDRASAMKQHFCPVSGAMLGTMGAPEKVDVDGQMVWICCDGCKDKLLGDPDKYLAKLTK